MKVAHAVVITPHRCGLYETTRELVAGLRELGVDSRMVDPAPRSDVRKPDNEDRGALYASMDWGTTADIVVNHSGFDNTPLGTTEQPIILVAHGRPRSGFISELRGSTPCYSFKGKQNKNDRLKKVVTFWTEHLPYWQFMMPHKEIHFVPPSVDLDAWKLDGPSGYKFHGHRGSVNIVISDPIRDDVDWFYPLQAAGLFAREEHNVKVHVFGRLGKTPGHDAIIRRIQDDGHMGEVQGWVSGLENVYRAASMLLTGNEIATRSMREAMACGCPVVTVRDLNTPFRTDMRAAMLKGPEDRVLIRKKAEVLFSPKNTAIQFKRILEEVAGG
jgi:glycosyltransferase involved in cell wall biosynthesis